MLGQGAFGFVVLNEYIESKILVFIKKVAKTGIGRDGKEFVIDWAKEVAIAHSVDLQFVVFVLDSFETRAAWFLVMEYCPGGTLLQEMKKNERKRRAIHRASLDFFNCEFFLNQYPFHHFSPLPHIFFHSPPSPIFLVPFLFLPICSKFCESWEKSRLD